ncbi:MAG: hypothetical protein PHR16_12815 [Methylovulum sp.]|nr:hypothetical protein [Methylovulum sp.]
MKFNYLALSIIFGLRRCGKTLGRVMAQWLAQSAPQALLDE